MRTFKSASEAEDAYKKYRLHWRVADAMRTGHVHRNDILLTRQIFEWMFNEKLRLRLPHMKDSTCETLLEALNVLNLRLESQYRIPCPFTDAEGRYWFACNHTQNCRNELAQILKKLKRERETYASESYDLRRRTTYVDIIKRYFNTDGSFKRELVAKKEN